jgi:integrase
METSQRITPQGSNEGLIMASIRKRKFGPNKDQIAYVVDYRDQHGKRHLKTFPNKKAAKDWSVNALHEVQHGIHTPASVSKTVEEVWRLWLTDCEANNLEFSTIRQRRIHLNHHIAPFIGRLRLSSLTTPLIYEFDSKLREAGRSLTMRRKLLTNLKTVLSFAQERGLVAQNAARGVRIKADSREATTGPLRAGIDFPTMAELNALIEKSEGRWRPFIVTAIFTGMRLSELRGLIWANVDLDAGIIHVRQRANQWSKMGQPKSKAGKRDIPLAPIVVNALKQWRSKCPHSELGLVFPSLRGNIIQMSNVHLAWSRLQAQCGLTQRYRFHMLRHAAASLFIKYLGWSPKRLQAVMGHASVTMTFDRYGHLFEDIESDRADMAKIEAAIRAA